jgi:putative transcriptional regulator
MSAHASPINLTNQFLIAMPGMADETFAGTVVYLCEHNERGALGLVINKPIDIKLKNLFEKVDLTLDRRTGRAAGVLRRPGADRARFRAARGTGRRRRRLQLHAVHSRRAGHDHQQGRAGSHVHGAGPRKRADHAGLQRLGAGQLEDESAATAG